MRSFTINQNDAGQRLDKFITKSTTGMPKSLMYKFIRTKRIKVNGGRAHENDMLSAGDLVEMYIPDEFFGDAAENAPGYSKVKTVPDIIYEDENILLCNKKPGILVHTGDEGDKNRADADEMARQMDRIALAQVIEQLPPMWKKIILLRYYRDMTQQQVADLLGLTQVKVSREEKKIMAFMRERLS